MVKIPASIREIQAMEVAPEEIICVMERMRCLTALLSDDRMRGWTLQRVEDGCSLTNEAIFRATAKCRL
ncbi:MAG TPA: hypothetical protein VF283_09380 [Bryobacteraceae bacterium]